MAQQACYGGYVGPAGDQQAGVGVAQGVDVQSGRQAVLLQDQLESLLFCCASFRPLSIDVITARARVTFTESSSIPVR